MKVRSPHKVYVPRMSLPINALSPCTCPPTIWRGTNPTMCKRPRENPAGSCQCSVDPVLSSHDAPYFEKYLSSQAFFTFVTTWASMEVCFTLFLYPFSSTVQNYTQLSLCATNPWYNELHNFAEWKDAAVRVPLPPPPPPPTNNFLLSYPTNYTSSEREFIRESESF